MARHIDAASGGFWRRRGLSAAALIMIAIGVAGCTTDGQPTLASGRGPTVAFEQIDGLPEGVFQKLVQALSAEAEARQLAVVSREGPAQYRIRGYAAAHIQAKRTTIAWVWDVYNADQQRMLRISGEEQAASGGRRRGWSAADDQTLRQIAHEGLDQLAAYFAMPAVAPSPSPEPRDATYTVAAARDDYSPESSGIYRLFSGLAPTPANAASSDGAAPAAAAEDAVPVPKRRPRNAGLTSQAALVQ